MRGRKPTPTALHVLRGSLNATRHAGRVNEPRAAGDLGPEPPAWMSESQAEGWRYAIDNAPRGLLKKIDRTTLAIWVAAEDAHRSAVSMQARLDANSSLPLLVRAKDGTISVSPYLTVANKAALVMLKAVGELGFSPASRPRIMAEAVPDPVQSPWDRFDVIQGGRDDEPEDQLQPEPDLEPGEKPDVD